MADWGYPEIDDVVILNTQNHQQFINDFDEALVYYHLPKCKHCVKMDKFFGAMALDYKERDQRIPFASFDCSKDLQFCNKKGIPAYPYIKLYIRDHPIIYYDRRDRKSLDQFIQKVMSKVPIQIQLKNLENIQSQVMQIVYFGQKSSKGFHLFDLAGKLHQEFDFWWIENNFEISEIKEINVFRDSDFHKTDFQNDIFIFRKQNIYHSNKLDNFESVNQFINKIKHPDVIELDDTFYDTLRRGPQEFFVLFVENYDDPIVEEFQKFAHDHKNKIKFMMATKNQQDQKIYNQLSEVLLIDNDALPAARIFQTTYSLNTVRKYQYQEQDLNYNNFQMFFRDFKANKLQPYFKFQKITRQNYGNLEVLNSYNYMQKVIKSGQDSVVIYHSNFDKHKESKKMLKILQKISENSKFSDIKYFTFDADQNEIGTFFHDQRPVLLLYSKKDLRNPLIYDKECDFKKVKNFIKSKKNLQKNKDLEEHFNTEL